ncbi:hypothetical protein K474DRAFT_1604849 [Panus rudis PR-1116 ss-1]|nr:hypothetical protein K474DRAFT_1604849 [Panus rudis PR-1116 ss-1]
MPTAPVDREGTVLYYKDSGRPRNHQRDYTTVILIHGTYYNGAAFQNLLPLASDHNIRIITLNQRDYTGSTPLNDLELAKLTSEDPGERLQYLKDRAKELAAFVIWLIQNENLLPIQAQTGDSGAGQAQGGVSIMGWSSANHQILPLLAYGSDLLTSEERTLLGRYLRSYVMYDAPHYATGMPVPKRGDTYFSPIDDPSFKPSQLFEAFPLWVSSYYSHSPDALNALPVPDSAWSPERRASVNDNDILQALSAEPDKSIAPTTFRIPAEATESFEAVGRSHIPVLLLGESTYHKVLERALFGTAASDAIVSCGRSIPICVWSAWKVYDLIGSRSIDRGAVDAGTKLPVRFHLWREFNHFPHWDHPEQLIRSLAEVV